MPLLIVLKEPSMTLIVEGEIKDKDEEYWDGVFSNGCLIVKSKTGQNIVVPLWKESNITFIKEVTEEQIEEQRKKTEETEKEAEKANRGNRIAPPNYAFPASRNRGPGGGIVI